MENGKRIPWIGVCVCLLSFISALVAVIIYNVSVNDTSSYWYGQGDGYVNGMTVFAIVLLFFAIIAGVAQLFFGDEKNRAILQVIAAVLQIMALCFLWSATLTFVNNSVEGLGYILASDSSVAADVARYIPSANRVITGFVFYGIAAILPMIGLFFPSVRVLKKKTA